MTEIPIETAPRDGASMLQDIIKEIEEAGYGWAIARASGPNRRYQAVVIKEDRIDFITDALMMAQHVETADTPEAALTAALKDPHPPYGV